MTMCGCAGVCVFGGTVACVKAEALPPHSKGRAARLPRRTRLQKPTQEHRLKPVLLRDGGEEFGQAEDAGIVAGFALDDVHAGPVGIGFFGGGCDTGDGDFDFNAIV
jgi:hypothetical protein